MTCATNQPFLWNHHLDDRPDHPPPHFHPQYGADWARIELALVMEDLSALAELFEEWAVLAAGCSLPEVRGSREAAEAVAGIQGEARPYVAGPRRAIQIRSRALVVTHQGANVVHRGENGARRYEVLHLWPRKET